MLSNGLETVLCDMDGTLVFTYRVNLKSYQAACADHGLYLKESDFESAWGSDAKDFLPRFFGDQPATVLSNIRQSKAKKMSQFLPEARINKPLLMLLTEMKGRVKLGLVTNAKSGNVSDVLRFFQLETLFDTVVTGDDVSFLKPAPDPYLLAMSRLESDPFRTLAIEDSPSGKSSAISAGIQCMMIGKDNA
jgi:beta-phosphoglucomutase